MNIVAITLLSFGVGVLCGMRLILFLHNRDKRRSKERDWNSWRKKP